MYKKILSLVVVLFVLSGSFAAFAAQNISQGASAAISVYFGAEGGFAAEYTTRAASVRDFLNEIDIKLDEYDEVSVPLDGPLQYGMMISVRRAFAAQVLLDDKLTAVWVKSSFTVEHLIADLKDKTGVQYTYGAALGSPIVKNTVYALTSIKYKETQELFLIPYEVVVYDNPNMPEGMEAVFSYGEPGIREITYNVCYIGGQEEYREIISVVTVTEPTAHIIYRGVDPAASEPAAIAPPETVSDAEAPVYTAGQEYLEGYSEILTVDDETVDYMICYEMTATAYTAASTGRNSNNPNYGLTATGIKAEYGTVAVDREVIPLGTKLYIEEYGYATAADTGPSIKGNKIDLYFETLAEARQFGKKTVKVYMLSLP